MQSIVSLFNLLSSSTKWPSMTSSIIRETTTLRGYKELIQALTHCRTGQQRRRNAFKLTYACLPGPAF